MAGRETPAQKAPKDGGGFAAEDLSAEVPSALQPVRRLLRKANSALLDQLLERTYKALALVFPRPFPAALRALASVAFSRDPLKNAADLPEIDIAIPFVEKDIRVLPYVVESARDQVRNPIRFILLVSPADEDGKGFRLAHPQSLDILSEISSTEPRIRHLYDQNVIGEAGWKKIQEEKPGGWIIQQLVKMATILRDGAIPTLIIDSDTVLLDRKTWLRSDGVQLLQIAYEYEQRYMGFIESFFGLKKTLPLSFVTHHTMMQPAIVWEMFPQGQDSLIQWWQESKDFPGAVLAENESYGCFLYEKHREKTRLGGWSNLLSPYFQRFERLRKNSKLSSSDLVPNYCSVSFHAHSQKAESE